MSESGSDTDTLSVRVRAHLDSVPEAERAVPGPVEFCRRLFVDLLGFDDAAATDSDDRWAVDAADAVTPVAGREAVVVAVAALPSLSHRRERAVLASLPGEAVVLFSAPDARTCHLATDVDGACHRFALGQARTHRGAADALAALADGAALEDAFSIRRATTRFHADYRDAFETLAAAYREAGVPADETPRFAHGLLARLLGVAFRATPAWPGGRDFLAWFREAHATHGDGARLHDWLVSLFDDDARSGLPDAVSTRLDALPALEASALGDVDTAPVTLPDEPLHGVLRDLLAPHEFTPAEETRTDVDLAVTPAVLGRVHESLLTAGDRETGGVFYTPRDAVDRVCRLAVFDYLDARTDVDRRAVRWLVFADESTPAPDVVDGETRAALADALDGVRVLDPACGAGAFLLGALSLLRACRRRLGLADDAAAVGELVEASLFGVDVADWAVRVAAMRLELAVVAAGDPDPLDVTPRLRVGDSLLGDAPEALSPAGFDVVVGNPPYVPHQDLSPPADADAADRDDYRDALRDACEDAWDVRPYRRSDLYVYFFFRGRSLLRPGGALAFLTSNAWLDVGYGAKLQAFLLRETDLRRVVADDARQVFGDADVNTVVTCLRHPRPAADATQDGDGSTPDASDSSTPGATAFVRVDDAAVDDAAVADPTVALPGDATTTRYRGEALAVRDGAGLRSVAAARTSLWRLGGGEVSKRAGDSDDVSGRAGDSDDVSGRAGGGDDVSGRAGVGDGAVRGDDVGAGAAGASPGNGRRAALTGRYRGAMWGAHFHRAPDCFFSLLGREDALVTLERDRLETYLNTGGADDFFFLDVTDCDGETVTVATPDGPFEVEAEYVAPFVASPRDLSGLRITPADPDSHLLVIPGDVPRERLRSQSVWEYVEWGEDRGFHRRSGRRNRDRWEVLPDQARGGGQILVGCYMQTPRVFFNPDEYVSHRFFRYHPARDPKRLAAALNSAVTLLSYELFRNPGLGGGVLAVGTDSIASFLVVDPARLSVDEATVDAFLERPQEDLFAELGLDPDRPLARQTPAPRPDRRAVDDAAFDALGLPESERDAVYRALASLTRDRIRGGD